MTIIHIANTDFEFELALQSDILTLEESWNAHSLCLQLQFLPFLYADPEDEIVVSHIPDSNFLEQCIVQERKRLPSFKTFKDTVFANDVCVSWGASKKVQRWCEEKKINYSMPPWNVVKEVNSKSFSFNFNQGFLKSALIRNRNDLENWLKNGMASKYVLKTCFGLSGRGHYFIEKGMSLEKIVCWCEKEWLQGRPLIGEPWLDRIFDFSTQWHIHKDRGIEWMGSTIFEANKKGVYQATYAGPEKKLFSNYQNFLEEHKEVSKQILQNLWEKGFFGYVGVDAFLFSYEGKIHLRPIVEINARQTMSLAAVFFQKKWFLERVVKLYFAPEKSTQASLLPLHLANMRGESLHFNRKLCFSLQEL